MDEILKKLKIKFVITTTLIAGIFLLAILGGFFAILVGTSAAVERASLDKALHSNNLNYEVTNGRRCYVFVAVSDFIIIADKPEQELISYYGSQSIVNRILETAISKDDGEFSINKCHFIVQSKTNNDASKTYAILDRTSDRDMLANTGFILAILYIMSLLLASLLSYLFSGRNLKPIEDSLLKQRDLIANASHELKTPLTIISTNLAVLQSEPQSTIENNEKWIESIQSQILRMNGLIQNMLELSKLEQSVIPKENTDFGEIVEGACLSFEAVCFEKNVTLLSELQKPITVYGDKNALERLVVILLDNATKYSGKSGKVGCKLSSDGKRAHLVVMNTGECISKDDATHAFDRFYRADGARKNEDNQSFGLGLSIAQATVFAHGGQISCHGVKDKGTVFDVYLPVVRKGTSDKQLKCISTNYGVENCDSFDNDEIDTDCSSEQNFENEEIFLNKLIENSQTLTVENENREESEQL